MTKDEALRLALEALEDLGNHDHVCPQWPTYAEPENYPKCNCGYDQAITAIKAALEAKDEPIQEPAAWISKHNVVYPLDAWHEVHPINELKPLYTTPPQRKPLTADEIQQIFIANSVVVDDGNAYMVAGLRTVNIARAIEAAHGIKGESK